MCNITSAFIEKKKAHNKHRKHKMTQALTTAQNKKVQEWFKVKNLTDKHSAKELQLRKELFEEIFPEPTEGSKENKITLGDGFIIQGDYKINRKIDVAMLDVARTEFNKLEVDAAVFDNVINYKPALKLANFKGLSPKYKVMFGDAIIETPGTPGLKVVAPKK